MNVDFFEPNPFQRGHLTLVNTDYLNEPDAFLLNEVVRDWPACTNPFLARMASCLKVGAPIDRVSFQAFMELAGALTQGQPGTTFTFAVLLNDAASGDEPTITASLINIEKSAELPIEADNAGFFKYAMKWFKAQKQPLTLSVAGSALFWVHGSRG